MIKLAVSLFFASMGLSLVLTPAFRFLASRIGFVDAPADNHKRHEHAVPLLGGPAMFMAWLAVAMTGGATALFGSCADFGSYVGSHLAVGLRTHSVQAAWVIIGAAGAMLLGLVDDARPMKAHVKFLGQFLISLAAVLGGGVRINVFVFESDIASMAVTVFWFMLLMNSINFFDNMDGLAAGCVTMAMAAFCVVTALGGQVFATALCALNCGVVAGFWFYNTSPARIFMGDSGSHFLGYLCALTAATVTYFMQGSSASRLSILMPLFILAVPLFDTLTVVVIRTWAGRPFWIGDNNHISHRFVRMGFSRAGAVRVVHLLSLALTAGAFIVYKGSPQLAALAVVQTVLVLVLVTAIQLVAGRGSGK
ncbi:MAG: undecaprenyl/decaprenyl-phosphate alpha-N-acetylglucosaminyl 1-phosphate transferase [Victivallaceae bacterium]|nr:undecaprenyl/decaprenyl-phosphate alpha-N-acetylglucosaminyl 1-phosphate transferase [Victivallaceae bacterium]